MPPPSSESNIAIRVRNLGKKYTLGDSQERYHTLRDAVVNSVKAPFKRISSHESYQEFWALKTICSYLPDISSTGHYIPL